MKTLCILFIIILGEIEGLAQNTAQIKGSIKNTENEPVMFSTVFLLDKDSVYIKGDVSKEDGSFLLSDLKAGTYRIKIQNVEYQPHVTEFFNLAPNEVKILKSIPLTHSVAQLNEVVVTGAKSVVEVHADRMVFNVANSANTSGNNGLELLNKTPGVKVDPDNNILLQGKAGVQIYINGRPSRLSGSDLTAMLQSTQADNIESIEVITNPPAKYEAAGTAGIINIKMKKNNDYGYNGTLISNYSKGDYARNNNGLTLNYKNSKINVNGNVTRYDNDFQSDFVDTKEQSGYLMDQQSYGLNLSQGYNFSGDVDYAINDKHSLSFTSRGVLNNGTKTLSSETSITKMANDSLASILVSPSQADLSSKNFNYNVNYQFIPSKTSTLTADLSLGNYTSDQRTNQPNQYYAPDGTSVIREVNNAFNTNTQIDFKTAQLDYEKKFSKLKLSTGGKYNSINTDNEFEFYKIENGQPILDINKSNNFTYVEKVSALYAVINSDLSPKINLNAGLRMEHTNSEGILVSEVSINDSDVKRSYTNYFPNVGLSYDNKKASVISVSLGKRINRPNYQDLNPFETKLSEIAFFKGNPFLKPNYVMNYSFTYAYKQKLILSNTYSVTTDYFANILVVVNGIGTFLKPFNMQKSTNNGLTASYPLAVTKWWDIISFVNYNYSTYKGDIEGTIIDIKAHVYDFRIQNNFVLPGHTSLELSYFYNSPSVWRGSIRIDPFSGLYFGLRKDFFKNRMQLRLTGSDMLNKSSDYHYHGNYGGLKIDGVFSQDNRRYGAGLTFKFGNEKMKGAKKRKTGLDDSLERISN